MRRTHRRYFFFTLAVFAGLFAARSRGQGLRTFTEIRSLTAIDRGLETAIVRTPSRPFASARSSMLSTPALRAGASGLEYATGRVIVKFRDGVATASRVRALSAVPRATTVSTAADQPSYANFEVVRIDAADDPEQVAAALRSNPDVEYAQAAYRARTRMVPTDQYYQRYQWNLRMLDLERAWDIQPLAGSTITVAVLDTGIAYQSGVVTYPGGAAPFRDDSGLLHPAIPGPLQVPFAAGTDLASAGRFVFPHDFIWDDNSPFDTEGHGTHVSGTIGQLTNNNGFGTAGVAFNVKFMPVKVIDSDWDDILGAPNFGTDDIVARGIRYAADNGAKVINMSIGRTGPANCATAPSTDGCAPAVEAAIKYAVGKGVFVAVAGGNEFEEGNPTEVYAEIASRVNGAVSVAAVDASKNRAYYSNTGSWVELAAPGGSDRGFGPEGLVLQQTLDPLYGTCIVEPRSCGVPPAIIPPRFDVVNFFFAAGTSMATPHVSGAAAMLMQQGITDPAAVEAALEQFAVDLGTPGRDPSFGFGLVQVRNALRGLGLAR